MTGIERLRKLIEDYRAGHECDGFECTELSCGKCMAKNVLKPIADQIEREQDKVAMTDWEAVRDVCDDMARRVSGIPEFDDLVDRWFRTLDDALDGRAGGVHDTAEEREAIAWVREHGGLEAVRKMADIVLDVYQRLVDGNAGPEMLKTDADTIDAMMAEIDEAIVKRGKERTTALALLDESVPRITYERHIIKRQRQIDESHAALRRRNARIGFLVSELNRANHEIHEEFMLRAGDYTAFTDEVCKRLAPELRYVEGCSKDVMDAALDALDRRLMPEGMEWPRYEDGEPVKFGDKVPTIQRVSKIGLFSDGSFTLYNGFDSVPFKRGERVKRPESKVLDADWVDTSVGDTVYDVDTGEKMWVCALPEQGEYQCVKLRLINGMFKTLDPCRFTHRAPVLAADGKPLRERPDSWERWREEWQWPPVKYCKLILGVEYDHDTQLNEAFDAQGDDLVRRAKALAGDA